MCFRTLAIALSVIIFNLKAQTTCELNKVYGRWKCIAIMDDNGQTTDFILSNIKDCKYIDTAKLFGGVGSKRTFNVNGNYTLDSDISKKQYKGHFKLIENGCYINYGKWKRRNVTLHEYLLYIDENYMITRKPTDKPTLLIVYYRVK